MSTLNFFEPYLWAGVAVLAIAVAGWCLVMERRIRQIGAARDALEKEKGFVGGAANHNSEFGRTNERQATRADSQGAVQLGD